MQSMGHAVDGELTLVVYLYGQTVIKTHKACVDEMEELEDVMQRLVAQLTDGELERLYMQYVGLLDIPYTPSLSPDVMHFLEYAELIHEWRLRL